jgi:hypothetical protein
LTSKTPTNRIARILGFAAGSLAALTFTMTIGAGPASAGAVYVPLLPTTSADLTFFPQVVIGNGAAAKRTYSQFFIGENQNGVPRPGAPTLIEIPNGDTVGINLPTGPGMLELVGSADVMVYGTMPGSNPGGKTVLMPLPVVTSSNSAEANDVQHLVGLARNSNLLTNVAVINLGRTAATCSVKILDNQGNTLINASTLSFQPLSLRYFSDALSGTPAAVNSARAEVSCNQQFYSFATVHSTPGSTEAVAATVVPAATGASSLPGPSTGGGGGNCANSTARHCYTNDGLVFQPARGSNQKRIRYAVSQGTYKRVHFSMDVFFSGLNSRFPGGLHQFFWMAINSRNPDLLGFTSLRDGNKAVMLRAGIGVDAVGKSKIVRAASLVKGETYHMDYIYDTEADDIIWTVTEKSSGRLVVQVFDVPNVNNVNFGEDGHMAVDLSFNGENPVEPPSWGWRYENLFFEIFSR